MPGGGRGPATRSAEGRRWGGRTLQASRVANFRRGVGGEGVNQPAWAVGSEPEALGFPPE